MSSIYEGMTVEEIIEELRLIQKAGFGNETVKVDGTFREIKMVNLTSSGEPYIIIN